MRLRQLGQGQSLMFLAPPSVDQETRLFRNAAPSRPMDGFDVVIWCIGQSCLHIKRSQPLRINQGLTYFDRQRNVVKYLEPLRQKETIDLDSLDAEARRAFIENEQQSLHDLYAPSSVKPQDKSGLLHRSRADTSREVQQLLRAWDSLDHNAATEASVHEEHEREIAHEVEEETQVQRPGSETPAEPLYDKRLDTLLSSGQSLQQFPSVNDAVLSRFSGRPSNSEPTLWQGIRASTGFLTVIKNNGMGNLDPFLRHVNWVLTSKAAPDTPDLVLISQYEANQIYMRTCQEDSKVNLHAYEPRVARSMLPVDPDPMPQALRSAWIWIEYVPLNLRYQLHLFAGQLYAGSYIDYLQWRELLESNKTASGPNLGFWKEWFVLRRRGQDFLQSHAGQVVEGRLLMPEDFE